KGITRDSNNAEVVLKMIIESVITQMMGLKVRKTVVVDKVADIWDVRMNYLKTNGTLKAALKFIRKVACLNKVECQMMPKLLICYLLELCASETQWNKSFALFLMMPPYKSLCGQCMGYIHK
ncbi:hypothetical protein Tco_1087173, partial [Tanacetum coccineum]